MFLSQNYNTVKFNLIKSYKNYCQKVSKYLISIFHDSNAIRFFQKIYEKITFLLQLIFAYVSPGHYI